MTHQSHPSHRGLPVAGNTKLGAAAPQAAPVAGLVPERLYSTKELAQITGFSESAFEAWRLRGSGGPPYRKLGVRAVRYLGQDVIDWVTGGRRQSTSESPA